MTGADAIALPDAEAVAAIGTGRLGGRVVLYSARNRAVVLSNEMGAALLDALRAARSGADMLQRFARRMRLPDDEAAATVARATLDGWDAAGLFGPAPAVPRAAADDAGAERLHLRLGTRAMEVGCADPLIRAQLGRILRPFRADASEGAVRVSVIAADGGYMVLREGVPVWDTGGLDSARYFVLRAAAEVLHGSDRVGAVLHAGAVGDGHGALAFTGASGRGKSTLIASAVAAGWRYLADDLLPLHGGGPAVFPLPVALGLKGGALGVPALARLIAAHAPDRTSPREGVTYLDLPAEGPLDALVPLRTLVFPEYDADGPEEVVPVPPETALREVLMAGGHLTGDGPDALSPLLRMLEAVPAVRLRYRSAGYALDRCRDLIGPAGLSA